MNGEYYIGLISGTSVDGIDACLCHIDNNQTSLQLVDTYFSPWKDTTAQSIKQFLNKSCNDLPKALLLDGELGLEFAHSAKYLIERHKDKNIIAIGCHGQTLRHSPNSDYPYSFQVGNGAVISQIARKTTVNDFRAQDLSLNGQGAPLAPLFHQQFFSHPDKNRAVINIGGISNITYLPHNKNSACIGFDCGPGNGLMDAWILNSQGQNYDKDGRWAASGNVHEGLLKQLLMDDYIASAPPKSTGPEHYNLHWLLEHIASFDAIKSKDIQATLLAFTAQSIANNLKWYCPNVEEIFLCGGGANNPEIIKSLARATGIHVMKTDNLGIHGDWIEACLFAWLAAKTIHHKTVDLTAITGASRPSIAGCIWPY